jgi:hypothetical protein
MFENKKIRKKKHPQPIWASSYVSDSETPTLKPTMTQPVAAAALQEPASNSL